MTAFYIRGIIYCLISEALILHLCRKEPCREVSGFLQFNTSNSHEIQGSTVDDVCNKVHIDTKRIIVRNIYLVMPHNDNNISLININRGVGRFHCFQCYHYEENLSSHYFSEDKKPLLSTTN